MKTRNEIIKDLEDRLFMLKFTRFEGIEAEQALGSWRLYRWMGRSFKKKYKGNGG
ncbi:hypothetical protein KGF43_20875 [Clostridioides sp. ZZV14-6044]|uniref:hypothetical protein n=1 Tax=Clostridioides sp. ZZV14-6044 TaxID=2811488 RepID=UPI001D12EF07|nr:hypothetical protein [Clostridioides sp. ZZV14-6044]